MDNLCFFIFWTELLVYFKSTKKALFQFTDLYK